MDNMKKRLILASASPRRRELLTLAGFEFEVIPAVGKEVVHEENGKPLTPDRIVRQLALHKAEEIFDREKGATGLTVIGADTIVVLDGEILGKPKDRADAKRMIHMLQGRDHKVYTGVAVLRSREGQDSEEDRLVFHEMTVVRVFPMSDEEIERYVATGEADDKAGAYGIQTSFGIYVSGIEGDYNNVVGLPIARLYQEMKKMPV